MLRASRLEVLGFVLLLSCGSGETSESDRAQAAIDGSKIKKNAYEKQLPPRGATKVVMLGTGTPVPDPARSGPATAVVTGGRAYLVDFGRGVVDRAEAAFRSGIRELEVTRIHLAFATHLHSDHTVGLPDLMLTPIPVGRETPLRVFGPPGIRAMVRGIESAYSEDLEMRAEGRDDRALSGQRVLVTEIKEGVVFKDSKVSITAFLVKHGEWPFAFGYRFDAPDRSVVISGDTAPVKSVIEACSGCDVLVHEVFCEAGLKGGPDSFRQYHTTHHTSTKQLADIAKQAKPKLLVLYHQLLFGCSHAALLKELTDEYDGEVAFANDLDVF